MATVTLQNLVKEYNQGKKDSFLAVDNINLDIQDGEFMVLVGPSGCGKSTTLRMIAGLEEITAGSICIGDREVNDVAPKDRDIAMVFQNYALYPHMSVYENMAFGLKLIKVNKAEIHTRVSEAAEILDISSLLERKPKQLSGGQRQRVALGRAIVRKPKVFLFDEPLSNLDAKMRVQMRTELTRLHEKLKATMIYVTHDQIEAMTMGNRICVMNEGKIMQVDEPVSLYSKPANRFVGEFIGSPPMNVFDGTLQKLNEHYVFVTNNKESQLAIPVSEATTKDHSPENPLCLGIRPEHITISTDRKDDHFEVTLELAEPLGAETYLHLKSGDISFTARVPTNRRYQRGAKLHVAFPQEHLYTLQQ